MERADPDTISPDAGTPEAAGPPPRPRMASRMGPRLAAVLLLAVACLMPGRAGAAASPEEVRGAVEEVLASGDYQRELPLPAASDGDDQGNRDLWSDPDWWRNEGDSPAPDFYRPRAPETESEGFSFDLPPALVMVLEVLMWVVFVAGGALVAFYLINEARLFSRWKKAGWKEDGEAEHAGDTPGQEGAPSEDYELLAARGEFAEAVHALLLRSISLIRERGVALSSALTSREILRRAPLEDSDREALSTLVGVTEVTHFGGRGATEADFLRCRELFERIAQGSAGTSG
jgi:hypothetical protein